MRWHVFLIPAKMSLALGFMEWLNVGRYYTTATILKPYFYLSGAAPIYPQWETLLIGIIVVILFSLLESGIIAALTILPIHPSRVLMLRLLIALSVIGVMSQYQISLPQVSHIPYTSCHYIDSINCNTWKPSRRARLIGETIETGFFTLNDMGTLLAANIMRPPVFAYRCCQENGSWYVHNRPFVARQLVAGLLGVLVYMATIFTVLRFVRDSDLVSET